MPITKEQVLDKSNNLFHQMNAEKTKCFNWRRNGKVTLWKLERNQNRFSLPVKYGLFSFTYIDETSAQNFHLPSDCPLLNKNNETILENS